MISVTDVPLERATDDVRVNIVEESIPQLPKPPEPVRGCCGWGRVFHHWSQYVLVATGVGGGAAGITAYFTNSLYAALISGGIIIVGGAAVFIGIGCLVPQRDLEDQIEFYREKLLEAKQQEQRLTVNIAEIREVKEALQQEVAGAKGVLQELQALLSQDTSDFDRFATNIGIFQGQANGLVDLYKKFTEMFLQVKRERDATQRVNKVFQKQIKELGGTVQTLEGNEEEFSQGLNRLDENVKVIGQGNQELDGHLEELQEFGAKFHEQVTSMREQVGELVQKVDLIDPKAWRDASKSVKDLKAVVEKLKEVTGNLSEDE